MKAWGEVLQPSDHGEILRVPQGIHESTAISHTLMVPGTIDTLQVLFTARFHWQSIVLLFAVTVQVAVYV